MYYKTAQVVDIVDEQTCDDIIAKCKSNPYSPEFGWFTGSQYYSFRNSVKKKIMTSALSPDGTHYPDVDALPPDIGSAFDDNMKNKVLSDVRCLSRLIWRISLTTLSKGQKCVV